MLVEFLARIDLNSDVISMKIPLESTFTEVIKSLRIAFNKVDLSYFEYLDEDNDTVIVSCEDDLQSVFLYYSEVVKDAYNHSSTPLPLQIFAKSDTPQRNPVLTICLEGDMYPVDKEYNSNTSSSKSNTGSTSGGIFISMARDERAITLSHSDIGSMSPMSEEIRDNAGQWSVSPSLCDENVYIIGEIGSGGTGKVMRALHTTTQDVIAVKIIDLDMDREDSMKQQILSELAVLRISKSPYIIEFYGAFFVESAIYICTEFMDGYSLDRYGIIDQVILGKLLVLIINGLVYLWTNKIIHRDVKPSNMLINTSGQVKLCDFGISKQLIHSIAKTYTGTVAFMSPERLKGESYRLSSDVWSLGISICILGTSQHPFAESDKPMTPASVMNSIFLPKNHDKISSLPLSNIMMDFVSRCLEMDPSRRFDTVSIMTHHIYELNCGNHFNELSQWVFDHSP